MNFFITPHVTAHIKNSAYRPVKCWEQQQKGKGSETENTTACFQIVYLNESSYIICNGIPTQQQGLFSSSPHQEKTQVFNQLPNSNATAFCLGQNVKSMMLQI
jgi:hypothetical protein